MNLLQGNQSDFADTSRQIGIDLIAPPSHLRCLPVLPANLVYFSSVNPPHHIASLLGIVAVVCRPCPTCMRNMLHTPFLFLI